MLPFNHITTAFPVYDKFEKQNRGKGICEELCDYQLICPKNALLPFQLKKSAIADSITKWEIREANTFIAVNITSSASAIKNILYNGERYFYYNGSVISGLDLRPGFYDSKITFASGEIWYTEMFKIPFELFSLGEPNKFLRLEWYSSCKADPIFYGDKVNDVPYFKNITYLDADVQADEPEIIEEVEEDGEQNEYPVFQKMIIRYNIVSFVPNFLKVALVGMQIHDHIFLSTPFGVNEGDIQNVKTTSALVDSGCYSTINILFEQDLAIIKSSCC